MAKTTTIAVIADSHFDETSRWEECCSVHEWIQGDMHARGVDLVLHAGDVYERRSTPRERIKVAEWLCDVAMTAPVVIVRGNHDAPTDLEIFRSLRSRHPIVVEEAAYVHVVAGVGIAALAWPRKGEIIARAAADAPSEEASQDAAVALQNVLRGLGDMLEQHDGPRVLLAHAMVRGSVTSTGQPLVGCDLEVGLADLALARADAYLLGHVHMPQGWEIGEAPVFYPGSPRRTAFGELETKTYMVLTFEGRKLVDVERVPTPCTPMLLVEGDFSARAGCEPMLWTRLPGEEWATASPMRDAYRSAEIRLRYTVAVDLRDTAKRAAAAWAEAVRNFMSATSIKVEEVVTSETRARAPEIAAATTLPEKLRAFWAARKIEMEPAREQRVIERASALEG